jgi:hypothetical protein
VCPSA